MAHAVSPAIINMPWRQKQMNKTSPLYKAASLRQGLIPALNTNEKVAMGTVSLTQIHTTT